MNDENLGRLVEKLRQLGCEQSTDIIITQDHNTARCPVTLPTIRCGRSLVATSVRLIHGYSVSGFVRTAELLTRDGLQAYDGAGAATYRRCPASWPMARTLPPAKMTRTDTFAAGRKSTPRRAMRCRSQFRRGPSWSRRTRVATTVRAGRHTETVKAAVVSLQSRLQFGVIFVSDRYGEIAGTLPMSLITTENSGNGRAPDVIFSFSYDENVAVAGKSGVSYASSINRRGDHGSFSPTDTHISLMASGPDFRSGLYDTLPTSNVDIAPTVARILEFSMPDVQGRVLEEALQGGPPISEYAVLNKTRRSSTKTGLAVKLPTDLDGRSVDPNLSSYSVELKTKILTRGAASYTYFDQAKAVRE